MFICTHTSYAEVNISTYPKWRHSGLYFFFVQKYSKLWCIVQKYWSGIFTCYTVITIDYLDLTTFSGMLPEAMKNEVKQ